MEDEGSKPKMMNWSDRIMFVMVGPLFFIAIWVADFVLKQRDGVTALDLPWFTLALCLFLYGVNRWLLEKVLWFAMLCWIVLWACALCMQF